MLILYYFIISLSQNGLLIFFLLYECNSVCCAVCVVSDVQFGALGSTVTLSCRGSHPGYVPMSHCVAAT